MKDVDENVANLAKTVKDDPWCVGVYVDNELMWDLADKPGEVAEKYFTVVSAAMKRHLPNHLYLGCRFWWGNEDVWREYPRPQMVRDNWTNLNGEWNYAVTAITNAVGRPKSWDGKILVPFGIEAPLSGVGRLLKPDEFLWYTRKIEVKGKGEGRKRILLNFESVDFRAQVFIGHREVELPHESMNVPFSLDITDYKEEKMRPAKVSSEVECFRKL